MAGSSKRSYVALMLISIQQSDWPRVGAHEVFGGKRIECVDEGRSSPRGAITNSSPRDNTDGQAAHLSPPSPLVPPPGQAESSGGASSTCRVYFSRDHWPKRSRRLPSKPRCSPAHHRRKADLTQKTPEIVKRRGPLPVRKGCRGKHCSFLKMLTGN